MDHYIPKRRIAVSLWLAGSCELEASLYLDLDPSGTRHQTILTKLNENSRFLPVATGEEGRTQLVLKSRLVRVTAGPQVLSADVYTRGFQPWREESAEVWLEGGERIEGRVWTPLERPLQRLSDFMNHLGRGFFVMLTPAGVRLINSEGVQRMALAEHVDARSAAPEAVGAGHPGHTLPRPRPVPMPVFDPTLGLGGAARR